MNCPTCNSPLEQNARFCGVCGYRVQAKPAIGGSQPGAGAPVRAPVAQPAPQPPGPAPAQNPGLASQARANVAPKPAPAKLKRPKVEDIYLEQVLNNRFRVESKIGEGGFGAVYRGVQIVGNRPVAIKLLHPEMTKDENLVQRFRREGEVLCKLRDAHTITTYDFDQTPDGTLYIAMELLEGKSLHQLFHEQAPLEWRRMFKILTEMCSSLAEAHKFGIVHRDLKPENIYLENRPGNPEFVKILDFGIAKVMRGDTIDPQQPQLTATGQTLGTLEYMSPEQLMGKALDGRSDVYALGVVAYEMITGRLPFPEAKGPAGLITAQLKQTPIPPSQANPKAAIPPAADRVILKCLEKDKNNRFPDVSTFSAALQEVINQASAEQALAAPGMQSTPGHRMAPAELREVRRELSASAPPIAPPPQQQVPSVMRPPPSPAAGAPVIATPPPMPPPMSPPMSPSMAGGMPAHPGIPPSHSGTPPAHSGMPPSHGGMPPSHSGMPPSHSGIPPSHSGIPPSHSGMPPAHGGIPSPYPVPQHMQGSGPVMHPYGQPMAQVPTPQPLPMAQIRPPGGYPPHLPPREPSSNARLVWWIIGLLAFGAAAGAAIAYLVG